MFCKADAQNPLMTLIEKGFPSASSGAPSNSQVAAYLRCRH